MNQQHALGYFITQSRWEEAIKLLRFQLNLKKTNRHYNTLHMFFFERCKKIDSLIDHSDYYEHKIKNNLFYALEKEFFVLEYLKPKTGLGLRRYKFLSYPMRITYYAIGIYLADIAQDFLEGIKFTRKNIFSYYGGDIKIDNNNLIVNINSVYWKNHYKSFRKKLRNELTEDLKNKMIIRLDIRDYFDDIDVSILLQLLHKYTKGSISLHKRFDIISISEIDFLFKFINNTGIPQMENDVISGFIGDLYLKFADIYIYDQISKEESIEGFKIIRYVDDIYISIDFKEDIIQRNREILIDSLMQRISDMLFYHLRLRLNNKSRLYMMIFEKDRNDFVASLAKISSEYWINNEDNSASPQDKIDQIMAELTALEYTSLDISFRRDYELFDETLKEVFDKGVENMLNKPENIATINELFSTFDFNLVRMSPIEIIIIILKDKLSTVRFRNHLLNIKYMTTSEVDIIITLLCQISFNDEELIQKLKNNAYMKLIMTYFDNPDSAYLGYYDLSELQIKKLVSKSHIIEQAVLRIFNEKSKNYSIALNHLLNEVHAICMMLDKVSTKSSKEYTSKDVSLFLTSQSVSYDTCRAIENLFDRRNSNRVSHPGSDTVTAWGVDASEYQIFRKYVGECLKIILQ